MIFDEESEDLGKDFLAHYGVPGMHWGIRKKIQEIFRSERAQYHENMANPKIARQVHIMRGVAIAGVGLYATGALVAHMQINPAPYIKGAAYLGNAMRNSMSRASSLAGNARVIFDQTGKMTYYAPGVQTPMRPNFDPMFNRQAINAARRALNP